MAYTTQITTYGAAAIAAAIAARSTLKITHLSVGDGNGAAIVPSAAATALTRETWRGEINGSRAAENRITIEGAIPASSGGYTIRELGLWDSAGKLVAIADFPATEKPAPGNGVARETLIRIVLVVSDASAIEIVLDPSIAHPTLESGDARWVKLADKASQASAEAGSEAGTWMSPQRTAQAIAKQVPAASEDAAGRVELATIAETVAGDDTARAVHARGVKAAIASHVASEHHFATGTRLLFAQASAPTGWTQNTTDMANNRLLRVVINGGYGAGGTHDPVVCNVVPAHTHGFTTGGISSDHSHDGWTGGQTNGHVHNSTRNKFVVLGAGEFGGLQHGDQFWDEGGIGRVPETSDVTADHAHYFRTGGVSSNHTHSGGTDNGSSQTNWQPRYLNLILCQKN
ncbi:phage tail protein [Uliginosibacterium paludis]|uniref:Phage tail protein n=1 Tax=Uliginosibacterium paludis TaxID=1615952 RepID=A0ABV2CUK9_9RHOO